MRAAELAGQPFFVATLFQLERAVLRGTGHPLVAAFVAADAAFARHAEPDAGRGPVSRDR